MAMGRVLSSLLAAAAVGGCAVVVLGMSHAANVADPISSDPSLVAAPSRTPRPAVLPEPSSASPSSSALTSPPVSSSVPASPTVAPSSHPATVVTSSSSPAVAGAPLRSDLERGGPGPPPRHARSLSGPTPVRTRVVATGQALPLHFSTGTATRVMTVRAHSHSGTIATLQAWTEGLRRRLEQGRPR